jgi:hypothetical protein
MIEVSEKQPDRLTTPVGDSIAPQAGTSDPNTQVWNEGKAK